MGTVTHYTTYESPLSGAEFPKASKQEGWPWGSTDPESHDEPTPSGLWPKISVVTPSFNQAAYLEETMRSVLLQGYPNLEYIVMDGGSNDNSIEIIRKYEPWLTFWQSGRDGGQANAINAGWRRSTGEAITWLNSDDVLTPGSLFAAAQALFFGEGADLVYGDNIIIDDCSMELYRVAGRPYQPEAVINKAVNPIQQPGFLMRRSMLDTVGELDESLHFAMDFDYWVRAALHRVRVRYIPEPLAKFREHSNAKTSTAHITRIRDRYRIFEKTFDAPETPSARRDQRQRAAAYVESNAAYIAYKASDNGRAVEHALRHMKLAGLRSSLFTIGVLAVSSLRRIRQR